MTRPKAADISWPAVLSYAGVVELRVVSDRSEWDLDPNLHAWPYGSDDRLTDSTGAEYRLVSTASAGHVFEPTGLRRTVAEVQAMAERHLTAIEAQAEWLEVYLADIPPASRIRATILFVSRHQRQGTDGESEDV